MLLMLLMEALGLTGQFLQPVYQSLISCSPMSSKKKICVSEIPEMSIKFYQPFLSYLYSNKIQNQDLLSHILDLLRVADTYDVSDLKDMCQDILIEDIDSENVMERLQTAFRYHLPRLKICCIDYLVTCYMYSSATARILASQVKQVTVAPASLSISEKLAAHLKHIYDNLCNATMEKQS
ncbi:SKP1/BTB/POZ domain-containing protein [Tanacetum coccineum]